MTDDPAPLSAEELIDALEYEANDEGGDYDGLSRDRLARFAMEVTEAARRSAPPANQKGGDAPWEVTTTDESAPQSSSAAGLFAPPAAQPLLWVLRGMYGDLELGHITEVEAVANEWAEGIGAIVVPLYAYPPATPGVEGPAQGLGELAAKIVADAEHHLSFAPSGDASDLIRQLVNALHAEARKPIPAGWSPLPVSEANHSERLSSADLNLAGAALSEWAFDHLAQGYGTSFTVREVARLIAGVRDATLAAHRPSPAPQVREALVLAEDVFSRAPFSTMMWPNGMHPNTGIEIIRAALAAPPQAESLKNALELTGCRDEADLIDMANVGSSLVERIADLTAQDGAFKGWMPADDPAEIVVDLVNHYEDAKRQAEDAIGAAEREVGRYVYRRIERLMDAKPNTPEAAELTYLAAIAENVEEYGEEACADHALHEPPQAESAEGLEEAVMPFVREAERLLPHITYQPAEHVTRPTITKGELEALLRARQSKGEG